MKQREKIESMMAGFSAGEFQILTVWYERAFGHKPEDNPGYFADWARRYREKGNDVIRYMDSKRKELYLDVLTEFQAKHDGHAEIETRENQYINCQNCRP